MKEVMCENDIVLSLSRNEEIFESFHMAILDGFAAGTTPLILNWRGAENIYPSKYIFNDIEETRSGLYFHPPITIINSKNIITLIIKPTGICPELASDANHWFFC